MKHFNRIATAVSVIALLLIPGRAWSQTLSEELAARADVVVDIHGSGDFTTVQEGIDAIPDFNDQWKVILVKKGTYYEKVILNYKKTRVVLVGEDVDSTIITYDDWGDKMLVDGDPAVGGHTFSTYTFRADPHEFQAYNITFENSTRKGQGVAFHSNGDKQILYHCRLLGFQDTYFDNFRTRRYMKDCFIEGATDFIFGFGVTLFDSCQVHAVSGGWLTASSTPQYYEFGHVFKDCRVTSGIKVTGGVYLGRPWFDYANTVFYECSLPGTITARGWEDWAGRGSTCYYREYNNFGLGSDTTGRIVFGSQLEPSRAGRYNSDTILAASNFPSQMGELVDSVELWSMRNRFETSGYAARADTVLYAGRDYWPEYPLEDWSPVFYDSIYPVIREYTLPFMDSINGVLEMGAVFVNGEELAGFHPDSLEYVIELPSAAATLPVFRVTGTGVTYGTSYPSELPGIAYLTVTSRDKVTGEKYNIYLSQDSVYWSTVPRLVVINYDDTITMQKGVYHYDAHLPVGDTKFSNCKIVGYTGQKSSYTKPQAIPGDLVITMISASKTDTADYTISFTPWEGIEKADAVFRQIQVLSPVVDRLQLRSDRPLPGMASMGIYDLNGRLVCDLRLDGISAGITDLPAGGDPLTEGIYIYRITSAGWQGSGKFIKLNQ